MLAGGFKIWGCRGGFVKALLPIFVPAALINAAGPEMEMG